MESKVKLEAAANATSVASPSELPSSPQMNKKELKRRAKALKQENLRLTQELMGMSERCQEIREENEKFLEELELALGPEATSDIIAMVKNLDSDTNMLGTTTVIASHEDNSLKKES